MPAVRRPQPDDAFHRRGLAGAVRSEDPEDLAFLDGEGDVLDRHGVAVPLVQLLHLNHWHALSLATAGRGPHRPASTRRRGTG